MLNLSLAQIRTGLLAISVIANGLLYWQVGDLQQALGEEKARADQLAGQVDVQNAAVDEWQRAALDQAALSQDAATRAATIRTVTQTQVARVLQAPVPQACPQAVAWAANWGRERGRQWAE